VGAILTQSTSWVNVEKAIKALKEEDALSCEAILEMSEKKLAGLIKPTLYHNVKARKLKELCRFLEDGYDCDIDSMLEEDTQLLRIRLLGVWGVGEETADSILLYAMDKPSFVVDAYTRRVYGRLGVLEGRERYGEIKRMFEESLPQETRLFQLYHAFIVEHCKSHCLSRLDKSRCNDCVLQGMCEA